MPERNSILGEAEGQNKAVRTCPGSANLPIGAFIDANREITVPGGGTPAETIVCSRRPTGGLPQEPHPLA
jgi:hypothetical protein